MPVDLRKRVMENAVDPVFICASGLGSISDKKLMAQFQKKGKLKTFLGMFTVPLTAGVLLMVLLMILAEIAMHDPGAGGL